MYYAIPQGDVDHAKNSKRVLALIALKTSLHAVNIFSKLDADAGGAKEQRVRTAQQRKTMLIDLTHRRKCLERLPTEKLRASLLRRIHSKSLIVNLRCPPKALNCKSHRRNLLAFKFKVPTFPKSLVEHHSPTRKYGHTTSSRKTKP